jgi:hypothetical protein
MRFCRSCCPENCPHPESAERTLASQSELVRIYPDRGSIPLETWHQLFSGAREEISVLICAALILTENAGTHMLLATRRLTLAAFT